MGYRLSDADLTGNGGPRLMRGPGHLPIVPSRKDKSLRPKKTTHLNSVTIKISNEFRR